MAGKHRIKMQTSIVGRKQTTIGGNGPGWYKEPRRHREAALKGRSRDRTQSGTQRATFRCSAPTQSAPRPVAKGPEPEVVPIGRRYDDLNAPSSDATLPEHVSGDRSYVTAGRGPNMEDWKIEDGYIVEGPAYTDHRRGKNWLATIESDPTAPGGLKRSFIPRGNGKYMYRSDLDVGDVYEVGADYYTSSGRKDSRREYGVIVENRGGSVKALRFKSSDDAIKFSRDLKNAIDWAQNL